MPGSEKKEINRHKPTKHEIKQQVDDAMRDAAEVLLHNAEFVEQFNIDNLLKFANMRDIGSYELGDWHTWNKKFTEGILELNDLNAADRRMHIMALQIFLNKELDINLDVDGMLGKLTLGAMMQFAKKKTTTNRSRLNIPDNREAPPENKEKFSVSDIAIIGDSAAKLLMHKNGAGLTEIFPEMESFFKGSTRTSHYIALLKNQQNSLLPLGRRDALIATFKNAKCAVLKLGGNQCYLGPDIFKKEMRELIGLIKDINPTIKIVVPQIGPSGKPKKITKDLEKRADNKDAMNEYIASGDEKRFIPLFWADLVRDPKNSRYLNPKYARKNDRAHYNRAGERVFASAILKKFVKKDERVDSYIKKYEAVATAYRAKFNEIEQDKQFEVKNEEVDVVDSDMTYEEAVLRNVHPDCPESILKRQVVVDVKYWGFDKKRHKGQLVVDKDLADDARRIFAVIYRTKFPIKSVIPISHPKYLVNGKWNDDASMKDNNTSGFNYRAITGGKSLSKHARGFSFDINPKLNPYIKGKTVEPPGATYDPKIPGTLTPDHPVTKEFQMLGWRWLGDNVKKRKKRGWVIDYQHFEKVPREFKSKKNIPRLKYSDWGTRRKSRFYNKEAHTQPKFAISSKRNETLEKKYPALYAEIKRVLKSQGIYGKPKALAVVAQLFRDYHVTGSYCGHFCKLVYINAGLRHKWLRNQSYNSVETKYIIESYKHRRNRKGKRVKVPTYARDESGKKIRNPKFDKNHYLNITSKWFTRRGKSSKEALQMAKKSLVDALRPGVYFVVAAKPKSATTHGFGFVEWYGDEKNMLAVVYGQPRAGVRAYSKRIINLGEKPIRVKLPGGRIKTIKPHKVTRIYDVKKPIAIMPSKSFVARARKENTNQSVA